MENKLFETIGKYYFMVVAICMYYFINEYINLGIFVTYRHAFALVLAFSALLFFLLKPNIARGVTAIKGAFIYSVPMLVTLLVSLFIWFMGQVDVDVITRGMSSMFVFTNMLSFTLAAVAFLYMFGEKGLWYNLIAVLASNLIMILSIIAQYGLGSYISELTTLILTFADQTGDIIVQAEVHELAFCLGAYMIYMILKPKKNIVFYILFALSCFCFFSAFKRIGFIAIALALAVGWLLMFVARFRKETAMGLIVFISVILVFILLGYVGIIRLGVFELLEEAGIKTSGRVEVYDAVEKFYEFSPSFLGNGIGFLTYQLSTNMNIGVVSVHNDFLQYFIDLGFWGYILWLVSMTVVRVCYFGAKGKTDSAIIALSLSIYLFIVSSTDNTVNYPLLTTVIAIIMIGHGFDERVREDETKMFGCVCDANKKSESESML